MCKTCGIIITSVFIILGLLDAAPGCAAEAGDGFEAAKNVESRYFNIFIENGVDTQDLAIRLAVPSSIIAIIKEPVPFSSEAYDLGEQLDLLFLAVSEIMDIRLKDFKCSVKICRNSSGLSGVAEKLFGRKVQTGGFYITTADTLYIDADNVTINILGHELSHAIQAHYFVVVPPVKMQEVLAGYAEYQLRKYTDSLPK
jgi:hypothetical protein